VYAQKDSTLNSFYIAAHVFSDAAPFWFEYILDVQPEGNGSRVRHIRIAPASSLCASVVTIRGMEKRVESPPGDLFAGLNFCSINVDSYNRLVAKFTRNAAIDDTVGYTVVASCGATQRVFNVPYLETLDLEELRKQSPDASHIIDLYSEVGKRVFPNEPLNGMNHQKDYELQRTAQSFIPDLRSGSFDAAFPKGRLAAILDVYQGPVQAVEPQPVLVDTQWHFANYVNPVYPPLARMAAIQSKVQLELTVDTTTGRVTDARVLSGHELMRQSALDAAKQWTFSTNQSLPAEITAALDYSLTCKLTQ
jgi:TonB family protein